VVELNEKKMPGNAHLGFSRITANLIENVFDKSGEELIDAVSKRASPQLIA
jgi:hypothetical protein